MHNYTDTVLSLCGACGKIDLPFYRCCQHKSDQEYLFQVVEQYRAHFSWFH